MPNRRASRRTPAHVFLRCEHVTLGGRGSRRRPAAEWTWQHGEQWAIVGPNGSGKSRLVQALLGRVPLGGGAIHGPYFPGSSDDIDPADAIALVSPTAQREVALRESSFYQSRWHSGLEEGQITVAEFLSQAQVEEHNPFEVSRACIDTRLFQQRQRHFVRLLRLRPLWTRRVAQLSNGELRKVLLVRALLRNPRLVVLEDPYAGLDPTSRGVLSRVIEKLMRSGRPVLVVTHRIEEIPAAATHLLLIDEGRIQEAGPRQGVLRAWSHRFGASAPSKKATIVRNRAERSKVPRAEVLLRLHAVTIRGGGKRILSDLNWTVRAGESWLLIGANGAGKTTLLNLIQGDHPQAYALDLELFGHSNENTQILWESRQQMGWISPELHQHYPPQWPLLDVVLSGFTHTLGLYQPCSRRQRADAHAWLRTLGLASQALDTFGELSFGQQRLVLLARAVVNRPRLLILDEPCQGLDPAHRDLLIDAVDHVVAQTGCSLIFVTHRAGERPRAISHVAHLVRGRLRASALRGTGSLPQLQLRA